MFGNFLSKLAIPPNISTYLRRTLIIITIATTVLIGGVLVIQQALYFRKTNDQKSQEQIEDQKIHIQEIVKNELEYIRIQNEIFKQKINEKIKQNVYQAINTAESIYQRYDGKKSEDEIKTLIIATISSLKFEMGYEEVFISTLNGTGIYYPRKPEFTGKNLRQFKDANGKSVIIEETTLLNKKAEGSLIYEINNKLYSSTAPHKKITFVKKFKHFNWYFGSKQYLDDYFPKFKDEVAQKISSVRFNHGGYLFMNQIDGTPIVMDGKVYQGNLNMLNDTLIPSHKIFLQQLDLAKNKGGGYFNYHWNKINEKNTSEKCSYVQLFSEYNWIIGAGFYLDEINARIQAQQKALQKDQQKSIITVLLLLTNLLLFETYIIYHFNKRYKSDFDRFFNFFFLSQKSLNKLNVSEFYFNEFKHAGIAANDMITQREEIEKKLIEEQKKATRADQLKSAFLTNMSHEIRTPMNAIIGFSELLEDDSQEEKDKATFIKLIRKNGEILLNLINDILDISKIEANLLIIRKKSFDLDKFLKELDFHYSGLLASRKDKNIKFQIYTQDNPDVTIITDEARLRQILDNLIGNAIKFTPTGSIVVKVEFMDNMIHFCVTDTGIGIPEELQASIFERFIQAEQGLKMSRGGTGLGLAISKNLVELLGGNLQVKSQPGKGSSFFFNIQGR